MAKLPRNADEGLSRTHSIEFVQLLRESAAGDGAGRQSRDGRTR